MIQGGGGIRKKWKRKKGKIVLITLVDPDPDMSAFRVGISLKSFSLSIAGYGGDEAGISYVFEPIALFNGQFTLVRSGSRSFYLVG